MGLNLTWYCSVSSIKMVADRSSISNGVLYLDIDVQYGSGTSKMDMGSNNGGTYKLVFSDGTVWETGVRCAVSQNNIQSNLNQSISIPSTYKGKTITKIDAPVASYYYGTAGSDKVCSYYLSGSIFVNPSWYNTAPTQPSWINYSQSKIKVGSPINVTWGASSDAEGNSINYSVHFFNGSTWIGAYQGNGTSFVYTIPAMPDNSNAQFRIIAGDGTSQSAWTYGAKFPVYNNNNPIIDGETTVNLGNKNTSFSVSYILDDKDSQDSLKVVENLNGNTIRVQENAPRGKSINITIDIKTLNSLPLNQQSNIEVSVDDGKGGISYKRWYFVRTNAAPIISNTDSNLGVVTNVAQKYSCHDSEGNTFSIIEKLDDIQLKNISGIDGTEYTTDIPRNIWFKLANGQHKYTITATDSLGASTTRTFTFTKKETVIESIGLINIIPTDAVGTKILLTPNWSGRENADVLFEVCNNAFDTSPTWEDATGQVLLGKPYFFTNKAKTATKWGIDIRFKLSLKKDATDSVSLYGLGGSFE